MTELLRRSYELSGRADREQSLFEPLAPGESLYLSGKAPDTVRIERAFLRDDEPGARELMRSWP